MPNVDPIELAVEMLDVEANKDMPDDVRAKAMFLRLLAPTFMDACAAASKKYGMLMLVGSMGAWLGELAAGSILPQFERQPTPEVLDAVIEHNVRHFERVSKLMLEEFKEGLKQ